MSQIPRSQFTYKKQQRQPHAFEVDHHNGSSKAKKNGNSVIAEKIDTFDNDVLIIDDNLFGEVEHEEVIATVEEELSPGKKKRNRKSKDSTESRESDVGKSPSSRKSSQAEKEDPSYKPRKSRADRLQNASTIVNLSTISTTESTIRDVTLDATKTPTAGERRTSGRRSTRPIDEIKFEYRTPDLDNSLDVSTNATIGSEANESLLTTPGTDRKRHITDSTEALDSPKRSRLDLSGIFGSFSSPVALLRNKFMRTNIASTPVVGGIAPELNDSAELLDEIKPENEDKEDTPATSENEDLKVVTTPISKKKACIVM